jgi:hypothetical protein
VAALLERDILHLVELVQILALLVKTYLLFQSAEELAGRKLTEPQEVLVVVLAVIVTLVVAKPVVRERLGKVLVAVQRLLVVRIEVELVAVALEQ